MESFPRKAHRLDDHHGVYGDPVQSNSSNIFPQGNLDAAGLNRGGSIYCMSSNLAHSADEDSVSCKLQDGMRAGIIFRLTGVDNGREKHLDKASAGP